MNLDDIYNQVIAMLKAGHSKQEVLAEVWRCKDQIAPLLDIGETLLSMPKNIVPTPLMQRKYAAGKSKFSCFA